MSSDSGEILDSEGRRLGVVAIRLIQEVKKSVDLLDLLANEERVAKRKSPEDIKLLAQAAFARDTLNIETHYNQNVAGYYEVALREDAKRSQAHTSQSAS